MILTSEALEARRLVDSHSARDASVSGAYVWRADISDDEALHDLLVLNGGQPRVTWRAGRLRRRGVALGGTTPHFAHCTRRV